MRNVRSHSFPPRRASSLHEAMEMGPITRPAFDLASVAPQRVDFPRSIRVIRGNRPTIQAEFEMARALQMAQRARILVLAPAEQEIGSAHVCTPVTTAHLV